jgi:ribosomal protein S18 acetylase RimI-like enzyme
VDVQSLGFRTDLMLRRLGGADVEDRGDHLVVRTPANPNFYWGNFLLVPPLGPGDGTRWLQAFTESFPDARHVAIGVDGTGGVLGDDAAFRDAGLVPGVDVVLTASTLRAPGTPRPAADLRPLAGDDDWAQSVAFRVAAGPRDDPAQRAFAAARQAELRAQADAGHGVYVGAFVDGVLVAELGCYVTDDGLARFQSVETAEAHRRRGLASALMVLAERLLRQRHDVEQLVIVADPSYVAIDLYRRLGFRDTERQVQWERTPYQTVRP